MPAYFLRITIFACFILTFLPDHLVSAADASMTITAQYRQDVPVTLDIAEASEISTLDPAVATDMVSIAPIENLFLGLTDFDPATNTIEPELATNWTISADGLTWTFILRNDVMWRRYDPLTQTATSIRPVVASDFVYGIKRACDPRLTGYYGMAVGARVIAGCDVINGMAMDTATDELVYGDTTQVTAPNDTTLVVILREPASYFLSMTTMPILRPVPQEAIETYGDNWTLPGNIVTNGSYFVQEIFRGVRRIFVRNTSLPDDLRGNGNIEIINTTMIEDPSITYALYMHDQLDYSPVPPPERELILNDETLLSEVRQISDETVFYFAFGYDKPPFDNVHVRRAFSAIIDRQTLIDVTWRVHGIPMIHFTPPNMFGAPPIDEIGVGFNPEYARKEMILAGYPECAGFPAIDVVYSQGTGEWVELWFRAAVQHLGCDRRKWDADGLEFSVINDPSLPTPTYNKIHSITSSWNRSSAGFYPDAHYWLADALRCGEDFIMRPCTATDDLIDQAARETDPAIRADLYRQIEEAFFGPDGEFPVAPLYLRANYVLVKSWYTGPFETDTRFGVHWEAYSIDMAAKLAARAAQ
ncbi:MAG: ABC transporter substrate-binding protein [Chloroflexota bacterium]|nr:MAG: ABC transporter substrate-binding protein [Chloroflexota bacterium]